MLLMIGTAHSLLSLNDPTHMLDAVEVGVDFGREPLPDRVVLGQLVSRRDAHPVAGAGQAREPIVGQVEIS